MFCKKLGSQLFLMSTRMKQASKLFLLLGISILAVILYLLYRYAVISPYRISSEEAKQLLTKKKIDLVLDVRTHAERSSLGYYPNSVHIQSADLEKEMLPRYPDKSIRILAYCNTGHRARMATDKLQAMGYTNSKFISSGHSSLL